LRKTIELIRKEYPVINESLGVSTDRMVNDIINILEQTRNLTKEQIKSFVAGIPRKPRKIDLTKFKI